MPLPNDTYASLQVLGALVDELAGKVAVLVAIAASSPDLTPARIKTAKGLLSSLVPSPAATSLPENSPATHAAMLLEKIASVAQSLDAVRSAGQQ